MITFTVEEITRQGYTRAHAEAYVSMLERSRAMPRAGVPSLVPPAAQPAAQPRRGRWSPLGLVPPAAAAARRPSLPPVAEASAAVIRSWAREAGVPCSTTGRIGAAVLTAYERARSQGQRVS